MKTVEISTEILQKMAESIAVQSYSDQEFTITLEALRQLPERAIAQRMMHLFKDQPANPIHVIEAQNIS